MKFAHDRADENNGDVRECMSDVRECVQVLTERACDL